MNIFDQILANPNKQFSLQPCILSKTQNLSYRDLKEQVLTIAAELRLGLGQTDSETRRIALLSENTPATIACLLAINSLGHSVVMLNSLLSSQEWQTQLELANCSALLCLNQLSPKIDRNHMPGEPRKLQSGFMLYTLETNPPPVDIGLERFVVFTSGSTGHVKGVRLSLENLVQAAIASNSTTELNSDSNWMLSLPIYHAGGLGIIIRCLLVGAALSVIEDFQPQTIVEQTLKYRPTHFSFVPTVLAKTIDYCESQQISLDLVFGPSSCILLAGAPSDSRLISKIEEYGLSVLGAWGMSETSAHCTCVPRSQNLSRLGSVGIKLGQTEIKVENPDTDGIGELLVRGPSVFLGYLGQESRNNLDWFHTGDIARIDRDGFVWLGGRTDLQINSGGEKINPIEIELIAAAYLAKHLPQVKNCLVIGIDDVKWGSRPLLLVECPNWSPEDSGITSDTIRNALKSQLSRFKVPDQVVFVDKLPTLANGKIDRIAAKQLVA